MLGALTVRFKNLKWVVICLSLFCTSCDFSYLSYVSYNQLALLNKRVSIEAALEKYDLTEDEKKKLKLIAKLRAFARETLKGDVSDDMYSTYIQLDRPYVTYLLRASLAYELTPHLWHFPVVGWAPYKGFFHKDKALKEAESFSSQEYDTYVRGVSAYSTLGWFDDSILSSMLSYSESDFVVTIFHELTHTVLFFKNQVNFNETFAEFVGRHMGVLFYLQEEGEESQTARLMEQKWEDELLFSTFMTQAYDGLDKWYKENEGQITLEQKRKRLTSIQDQFMVQIQPQLKTDRYNYFSTIKLNNAKLQSYRSYNYNIGEMEQLYSLSGYNLAKFIQYCIQLEKEEDPEVGLSELIDKLKLELPEKEAS